MSLDPTLSRIQDQYIVEVGRSALMSIAPEGSESKFTTKRRKDGRIECRLLYIAEARRWSHVLEFLVEDDAAPVADRICEVLTRLKAHIAEQSTE